MTNTAKGHYLGNIKTSCELRGKIPIHKPVKCKINEVQTRPQKRGVSTTAF